MTENFISEIDEDAFRKLPQLQELVLRNNKIRQLPELPATLTFIDISNNRLGRKGIRTEAFKVSLGLMEIAYHLFDLNCGLSESKIRICLYVLAPATYVTDISLEGKAGFLELLPPPVGGRQAGLTVGKISDLSLQHSQNCKNTHIFQMIHWST